MKLNPCRMEALVGPDFYAAGREMDDAGLVRMTERSRDLVRFAVHGHAASVTVYPDLSIRCDCPVFEKKGACPHVVAAWLTAEREKIPEAFLRLNAPACSQELDDLVLTMMPSEPSMRLEVTLVLPRLPAQPLRIGLRIGQDRLYVVRSIPDFLRTREERGTLSLSRGFQYEAAWMKFSAEDEAVLDLIRKLCSAREKEKSSDGRLLIIPDLFLHELMELLRNMTFRIMLLSGQIITCHQIHTSRIPLQFQVSLRPRGISVSGRITPTIQPIGSRCDWCLLDNRVLEVEPEQRHLVNLLWKNQYDGRCLFDYSLQETERFIGEVLPFLKLRGAVEISEDLRRRLVTHPLKATVYLDRDGQSIIARVEFRYGDILLDPFAPVAEKIVLDKGERLLLRDAEAEHRIIEILSASGFRVYRNGIRLSGSTAVFDFISHHIRSLQECCSIFMSREFKRIVPRRPSIRGGLRMLGDQMELFLQLDGEPFGEVLELMEALNRRQRYFRLKSGEFLDLSDVAEWQEIADTVYEAAVRDGNVPERDSITLRSYRAGYLSALLSRCGVEFEMDDEVRKLSDALSGNSPAAEAPPLSQDIRLRPYQQKGYEWLASLVNMHMGGILADDMGLGKTAQVIALLAAYHGGERISLIITPTSLTYNWLSEIHRFAPDLSAAVLSGTATQRGRLIRHALEHGDIDVLITSYPLIRRDIDLMQDYPFRFVILDEAQNIKNAGSFAAGAVKRLKADTRFALTGTPMENGVGELWSIFDFVLPGYLPGYNTFVRRYQDGENAEDLLRRIRPFLLRRLKQDVLSELPDKMESTLVARMTADQERLYQAALERMRPRISQLLDGAGMNRSHLEILSAITELREICCHPSLVLPDYRGTSGKEELVMDLLPDLIGSGRRILLFSQFTRMLKLLRTRLEENGYATLYLDGDTPAGDRLGLTERFNQGEGQIFLISLRAGGSGLNLTGADLVIHYDPWWNPATEDQATDRAHRIGQTRRVDVLRLVTAQTIEEQVYELGLRKKALFDRLITPGESVLSVLSEQEIRSLFF